MRKIKSLAFIFGMVLALSSCIDDNDADDLLDDRDAFLGVWNVTENCSKDSYVVTITKDPGNSSQVLINSFFHVPCQNSPYAIIAGKSMVLPQQDFCNSFQVNGSGSLNKNKITLNYTVNDGADEYKCSATYVKQ